MPYLIAEQTDWPRAFLSDGGDAACQTSEQLQWKHSLYIVREGRAVSDKDPIRGSEGATLEDLERRVAQALDADGTGWDACAIVAEWFYAHRAGLERFAGTLGIENAEDREDFFQWFMSQRFLRVWKAFRRSRRAAEAFRSYFLKAYKHEAWRDRKGRAKRKEKTDSVLAKVRRDSKIVVPFASADAEFEWERQLGIVLAFLETVPQTNRVVLELMFRDDMDVPEIVAYLGLAENCVRTRKSRGLQQLRPLVYGRIYHIVTEDILDWERLSGRIRDGSGFLERVRSAFPHSALVALGDSTSGIADDDGRSIVVGALNGVIDTPGFCTNGDLIDALGDVGASKIVVPAGCGHLRINRLVLDHALSSAMVPALDLRIL